MEQITFFNAAKDNQSSSTTQICLPPKVIWLNRFSLFLLFFWFGMLKVISASPAEALVTHLHQLTIARFMPIQPFMIALGILECSIGLMWLFPKVTRYVLILFLIQMLTTFLPLIILPLETWQNMLVLTLSGQYIMKNVVLVASAFTIYYDCRVRGWKIF